MDAITNLATDTASDRAAITQLTTTVARLTTELAMVNKKLIVDLHSKHKSRGSHRERDRDVCRRGDESGVGYGATERTGAGPPTL